MKEYHAVDIVRCVINSNKKEKTLYTGLKELVFSK